MVHRTEVPGTIENMRAAKGLSGVIAFSPLTREEYSADPGDYWNVPPGWAMTDQEGEPMILVQRVSELRDIDLSEED